MITFLVYITTQNKQQAEGIAKKLLEERLVACANIVSGTTSIYRWEGKIESAEECLLLLKTVESRLPAVMDKVRALHTYECPCVVAVPIHSGNPAFLDWIVQETKS